MSEHDAGDPAVDAHRQDSDAEPADGAPATRAGQRAAREAEGRVAPRSAATPRAPRSSSDSPADQVPLTRRTLRERRDAARRASPLYVLREIGVVVVLALLFSFVVKTWLVQPFFIPSGSMENTLQVGDRVLVSKLTPTPSAIQRGDVVVFEDPADWLADAGEVQRSAAGSVLHDVLVFVGLAPEDADEHLVKRVIGLPGDHVTCCTVDLQVSVNGAPIRETYLKPGDDPSIDQFDIVVPPGRLWVMGDHRSNSGDSRYHPLGGNGEQGSVPISKVVGRAAAVVWPLDRLGRLERPGSVFARVPASAP